MTDDVTGVAGSPKRGLAAKRAAAIAADGDLRVKVSGYETSDGGHLAVVYQRVPPEEWDRAFGKVSRTERTGGGRRSKKKTMIDGYYDWLIACCARIVLVDADGGESSPDPEDPTGDPPRFDRFLRTLLELDPETTSARDGVRELFVRPGEVISHGDQIAEWMGFTGDPDPS